MDDHFSRTLLALRRFIGVPLPGTELRVHGLISLPESAIRVLLGTQGAAQRPVDLPLHRGDGPEKFPPWWYVTAIRDVAVWMSGRNDADAEPEALEAEFLFSRRIVSEEISPTLDDALDFVIADLVGDPLWHDAAASIAPEIYTLVGFRLLNENSVRVYLRYDAEVIGVGLSVLDRTSGHPRSTGWWASTKVVAILRDAATLAAHVVPAADDPYCDAVYDLTRWA
ncbi:hypothetical protein [Streptomyces sp. HPF1205]|uniref:hypothetical protein n=1 Tax=Streptomyces sp. HPF1205 TaxID=2873262 RepID=UPI001CEC4E95|nr:hypothetical protein [Streptomyces sp. HPF1205]